MTTTSSCSAIANPVIYPFLLCETINSGRKGSKESGAKSGTDFYSHPDPSSRAPGERTSRRGEGGVRRGSGAQSSAAAARGGSGGGGSGTGAAVSTSALTRGL